MFNAAAEGRLEGPRRRREVGGPGTARHVDVARGVPGDGESVLLVSAPEVGGVDEAGAGGIERRFVGIGSGAADAGLEGPRRRREVGRGGRARHGGVAHGVHGNGSAPGRVISTEVGRVDEGGAGGIEFRHEAGAATWAGAAGLEGPRRRREVGGDGEPRHVSVAQSVHGDPARPVQGTPPDVGGVGESRASGSKLRHKGVPGAAAEGRLEGPGRRREVGGVGDPRHVSVARGVHGDPVAPLIAAAPQVGGVDEAGASGIEFRHESIARTTCREYA